jgi:HEAT repeat protein
MDKSPELPRDDQRPTGDLISEALRAEDFDEYWSIVEILHLRGTEEVFRMVSPLCRSERIDERVLCADVLGQLGARTRPFASETMDILIGMLSDESESEVLDAAADAIGHMYVYDPRALDPLLRLKDHPSAEVRRSVASALSGYTDGSAIDALIDLSRDSDRDVRDWAVHFGLDHCDVPNTPQVREALMERALNDDDDEVRAEALLALAHLGDAVRPALRVPVLQVEG